MPDLDDALPANADAATLSRSIERLERELEHAREQLERLSLTDAATGLGNRRALRAAIDAELARIARRPSPLALVLVDIDHLSKINDLYGRSQGDQTIAAVGASLLAVARTTDLVVRHGGQEFAVLLYDCPLGGAETWAERFRAALADLAVPGLLTSVTASFGVAAADRADTTAVLLDRAERACGQAKRAGRDRVVSATVVSPARAPSRSHRASVVATRASR